MRELLDVVIQFLDLFSQSLRTRRGTCGCQSQSKYIMHSWMACMWVAIWKDLKRRWLTRKRLFRFRLHAEASASVCCSSHQFARRSNERMLHDSICFSVPDNK